MTRIIRVVSEGDLARFQGKPEILQRTLGVPPSFAESHHDFGVSESGNYQSEPFGKNAILTGAEGIQAKDYRRIDVCLCEEGSYDLEYGFDEGEFLRE